MDKDKTYLDEIDSECDTRRTEIKKKKNLLWNVCVLKCYIKTIKYVRCQFNIIVTKRIRT